MILRLSEDEVKEAVAAWIRGKYADVVFGSVEKEQVKLETTTGTALTSRFNYAEIDLDKKPSQKTPKDGSQSESESGNWDLASRRIESGLNDLPKKPEPPPKPEPPKPEKYTKGGGSTPLPKKNTDPELDPVFGD